MVHYLIFAKPDMKSINEIYGKIMKMKLLKLNFSKELWTIV